MHLQYLHLVCLKHSYQKFLFTISCSSQLSQWICFVSLHSGFLTLSSTGLGSMRRRQNHPRPISHYLSNLTTNFLTMALHMLLTNALLGLVTEDNSMLKNRFAVLGMMMSSLPKFGNLANSNWFWSISLGLCMMIAFCLVSFMPLVVLREC